jgi:thioredoxin 1
MAENVAELTSKEFTEFIKSGFVLVDFFAEWCMPCLMMGPVVEEMSHKFKGKIKFGKVDVSDQEEIARKFNVSSIPNFTLLKDGKMVQQFVGAMSEEDFEEKLKAAIKK